LLEKSFLPSTAASSHYNHAFHRLKNCFVLKPLLQSLLYFTKANLHIKAAAATMEGFDTVSIQYSVSQADLHPMMSSVLRKLW
jgi:hypothetical protein